MILIKELLLYMVKYGTGKLTITDELRKLLVEYEVLAFQGFFNGIDKNKRLNVVVIGEKMQQ